MDTITIYKDALLTYEKLLLKGEWPLDPMPEEGYHIDVGIDPSMSSSGICVILRKDTTVLGVSVLKHTTSPHEPTPLRLSSVVPVTRDMIQKLAESIPEDADVNITILFEEPPTNMSSSSWLFALNQMIWVGFGPSDMAFLKPRRVRLQQYAIGNTQLKQLYFIWATEKNFGLAYNTIKKSKTTIVKIIKSVVDPSEVYKFLPKRYNNDVAEALAMACCAGVCSRINSYTGIPSSVPYDFVPLEGLFNLMTSKKVNKHLERMGWIYRPLSHAFGWC